MRATNELPTIFRMRFSSVRLITFFLRVLCHQFAFSWPGKPLEPLSYGFPPCLALRLTTVLMCSPFSRGRRVEAPVQQWRLRHMYYLTSACLCSRIRCSFFSLHHSLLSLCFEILQLLRALLALHSESLCLRVARPSLFTCGVCLSLHVETLFLRGSSLSCQFLVWPCPLPRRRFQLAS